MISDSKNQFNFILETSRIWKSYEKKELYDKEWDATKGELKSSKGLTWILAKFQHFFQSDEERMAKETEAFKGFFTHCRNAYAKDAAKSDKDSLNFKKFSSQAIVYTKKAIDCFNQSSPPDQLDNSTTHALQTYVEDCTTIARKALEVSANAIDTEKVKIAVVNRREIEIAAPFDENLNELKQIFQAALPDLALKAHDVFVGLKNSMWDGKSDLEVAEDIIPAFKVLRMSDSPVARDYARILLNIVTYGHDKPEILRGEKNPTIFWNANKIYEKIYWSFVEIFSFSNRTEVTLTAREKIKLGELKANNPSLFSMITKLINERSSLMGTNFIHAISEKYCTIIPHIAENEKNYCIDGYTLDNAVEGINGENAAAERRNFYKNEKADLCFIPYVFRGAHKLYPSHSVIISFDRTTKQIQYYDPQGLPPDHPDRLTNGSINMLEVLKQMRDEWEEADPDLKGKISIVTNKRIHQADPFNCPIYIADYMKRRCKGENFEQVCINGKNTAQMIGERDVMAKELLSDVNDIPVDESSDEKILVSSDDEEDW